MTTSPAPNAGAAMEPGVAALGGGGEGGDGDADGKGGKDGNGGGAGGEGSGAGGGQKNAAPGHPESCAVGHPVDVVTGRVFTLPLIDLSLPGPLPLVFERVYSSTMADRDAGLGFGWVHSLSCSIEVKRSEIVARTCQGTALSFPKIEEGAETLGPWGYLLRRSAGGFWLEGCGGHFGHFVPADESGRHYRLDCLEDRNNNRISVTYDGARLAEITDSAGRTVRVRSNKEGRIAALEVKNAASQGQWVVFASYTYDEAGNLTSATDAEGNVARYAYDHHHRLTADTDRTGLTFHFVYDQENRCVETWGDYPGRRDPSLAEDVPKTLADGTTKVKGIHHARLDYMPNWYTEVTDSTQVCRFFGNRHGTIDKRLVGPGVITVTYRDDGHMMTRTDAAGGTTIYERDARGRITSRTDQLGRVTRIERDAGGWPIAVTDAAGGVYRFERDSRGNVLLATDPTGATSTCRYDDRGMLIEAISPAGRRTSYAYDAQGNLISVTLPTGGVYRFTYDGLGRLLSRVDPLRAETRYSYSPRSDLIAVRDAMGGVMRYAYDGEGHITQIVDPKGQITILTWGGHDKLCEHKDANGNAVRLRYDVEGDLVEVHNAHGEAHRFLYTNAGWLHGELTFDGRELRYRRDEAGRVTRVTNGAVEPTDLTYDLAGQLVKRELCDGAVEEYAYDPLGNLISAKGPAGTFLFERNALGRVVRETQIVDGKEHWTEIAYDADGQRIGRKTSLGHLEAVTRGPFGERARTLLDGAHEVKHQSDLLGRETARALPGGGWMQMAYDALGRVSRQRAGGSVAESWGLPGEPEWIGPRNERFSVDIAYRYDETGELVESWDQARGRTQYAYDPIGQLLAMVPEKARAELFRYDERGNLYESSEGAEERVYGKGNRLLRKGEWEYAWDDDGRLWERRRRDPATGREEVWRYRWDAASLLKEVERPDGLRVAFGYDPFARRVSKRVSRDRALVSETRFVWDGDVLVHEIERRAREGGDPVVEERTYWFEDASWAPVGHRVSGVAAGWFFYVNDPAGAPSCILDDVGCVAREARRDAWSCAVDEMPAAGSIGLQGQWNDSEIGLAYNRYRYIEQNSHVFICQDPLRILGGVNFYANVPNSFGFVDPFGLAFARLYTRAEVAQILDSSEGRPSPTTTQEGHSREKHVRVPPGKLKDRVDSPGPPGRATCYESSQGQDRATTDVLNSAQGQAELAKLDANPGLNRVKIIGAPISGERVTEAVKGRGYLVNATANNATVIVDRLPGPGDNIHIQTSYGQL